MRSRKALLGLAGIGVLAATAVVGAVTGNPAVEGSASALLMATVGILLVYAVLAVRRVERELRRFKAVVRQPAKPPAKKPEPARADTTATDTPPPMTTADLVGTIRLLQAQYVGRLDSAQAALEAAAEQLRSSGTRES